jgi:FHS family glucose/mannose:H+ symporter-like MFS transporter
MYNKKMVFIAACSGMFIFGIIMTTLGAILPSVMDEFQIDKINAGSLMSFLSIGILISSMIFGPIADRYGYKYLFIICTALILIGMEGIAYSPSFGWLRLFIFLIGFGGGVLNGGTNALVADISEGERSARLSILGIFFGVGAIGIPLLLGILLDLLSYETFMSGVGAIVLLIMLFYSLIKFPTPKQTEKVPLKQGLGLLGQVSLVVLSFILFFESGIEITVGSWATTFLREELNLESGTAVFYLSVYWFGLMLARLILGFVLKSVKPATALFTCLLIALTGSVLMLFSSDLVPAVLSLFLIGMGFAATFPVILGYIGDLYPKFSGTAFSIAFVIALTGGTILPFVTGLAANSFGLRTSFILIPVSIIIISIIFLSIRNKITVKINN